MKFGRALVIGLVVALLPLGLLGTAYASEDGHGDEEKAAASAAAVSGSAGQADEHATGEATVLGLSHDAQHTVNQIAYTITPVLAIIVLAISIMLIRATGQTDKFTLISIGLGIFALQAVINYLFWSSEGAIVGRELSMLQTGVLNVAALAFIGSAFYRWKRMVG